MRQFDALLRQGLMDANLAQYENVLERADGREADFSPRYCRERMRLLADPWGWERRQPERPMLRRGRLDWRIAAIVAALLLLSACGYAIVTGQFTDWFPRLGFDQEHPESSEEALARMGTVIEESQTVNAQTFRRRRSIPRPGSTPRSAASSCRTTRGRPMYGKSK